MHKYHYYKIQPAREFYLSLLTLSLLSIHFLVRVYTRTKETTLEKAAF